MESIVNGLNWEYARQPVSQPASLKQVCINSIPLKESQFHGIPCALYIKLLVSFTLYNYSVVFFAFHSRDASNRFLIHHYAVIEWHSLNLARGNHARTIYSDRIPILFLRYGRTNKKMEHTHTNYYTKTKARKSWFCHSVYIAYSVW